MSGVEWSEVSEVSEVRVVVVMVEEEEDMKGAREVDQGGRGE